MSTLTYDSPIAGPDRARAAARPLDLLRNAWRANRPLTVTGLLMAATLVGTLIGLAIDPRVITGAPAWLKPTKFGISTTIYAFTFVWLLSYVQGHPRIVRVVSIGTATALIVEVAIIVLQVIRGTTSHFNFTTPLDGALFQVMGVLIVFAWLLAAITAGLLLRQDVPDQGFAWALRLGLLVALMGMAVAFFMPQPTPEQRAVLAAGVSTSIGAHSVGVADGGPGLPLVGWSTVGGDLRVAHFFGIHGMQVLPFIGWWLLRQNKLRPGHRVGLIWTAGLAYLGLLGLVTWQALRGQSIVAPDSATLGALSALLGATLLATGAILLHARLRTLAPHQGVIAAIARGE